MFIKDKTKDLVLPKGARETFAVRYRGGRKVFDKLKNAMGFATDERKDEGGWAEVTRVIEIVVSPR